MSYQSGSTTNAPNVARFDDFQAGPDGVRVRLGTDATRGLGTRRRGPDRAARSFGAVARS